MNSETIENFLKNLSSPSPVPAGGAVSALCGALACALGEMVGNIRQKKLQNSMLDNLVNRLSQNKVDMLQFKVEDQRAFSRLFNTLKLKKDTDEKKKRRAQLLLKGLISASQVPLSVGQKAVEILENLKALVAFSSTFMLPDIGCGVSLAEACLKTAILNVFINTKLMEDKNKAHNLNIKAQEIYTKGLNLSQKLYKQIKTKVI